MKNITFDPKYKFKEYTLECIEELENLGPSFKITQHINFTHTKRSATRFGYCRLDGFDKYRIAINPFLISKDDIKNTIIHEILHSFPDCMTHKGEWKRRAEIVNSRLNYKITRTSNKTLAEARETSSGIVYIPIERKEKLKHFVKCEGCGNEIGRMRMTSVLKRIKFANLKGIKSGYYCKKCGSENLKYIDKM